MILDKKTYLKELLNTPSHERLEFVKSQPEILPQFNPYQLDDIATLIMLGCSPDLAQRLPIREKGVSAKKLMGANA